MEKILNDIEIEKLSNEELKSKVKELQEKYVDSLSKSNSCLNIFKEKDDLIDKSNDTYQYLDINKDLSLERGSTLNHLIIEGDNYHSLSLLAQIKQKFVNVCYIDPPYSNQYYLGYENNFEHSSWLNFMRSRLSIAQSLLTDDGIMFISIDDGKYAYLKVLCDQIFGTKCYVGTIIWNKKTPHPNSSDIEPLHEYILVYKKSEAIKRVLVHKVERDAELYYEKDGRTYFLTPTMDVGAFGLNERPNMGYRIYYNPITTQIVVDNEYNRELAAISNNELEIYGPERQDLLDSGFIVVRPTKYAGRLGCWSKGYENFIECQDRLVLIKNNAGNYEFYLKNYITTAEDMIKDEPLKSIVAYPSQEGTRSLLKIFNNEARFKYPKNVELLKYLIGSYYKQDAVVLDFFAGSGTTGQAVLELNAADNGTRQFILCSNNENDSCTHCCQPRIKTLLTGIRFDGTVYADQKDGNLIYTKVLTDDKFNEAKFKKSREIVNKIRKEK